MFILSSCKLADLKPSSSKNRAQRKRDGDRYRKIERGKWSDRELKRVEEEERKRTRERGKKRQEKENEKE